MTRIEQLKQAYKLGTNSHLNDMPDEAHLNSAIYQANITIARYIPTGHSLSDAVYDGLVIAIALYILVGQVYDKRHPIYIAHREALKWLNQLAKGYLQEGVGGYASEATND